MVLRCQTAWASKTQSSGGKSRSSSRARPWSSTTTRPHFHQYGRVRRFCQHQQSHHKRFTMPLKPKKDEQRALNHRYLKELMPEGQQGMNSSHINHIQAYRLLVEMDSTDCGVCSHVVAVVKTDKGQVGHV